MYFAENTPYRQKHRENYHGSLFELQMKNILTNNDDILILNPMGSKTIKRIPKSCTYTASGKYTPFFVKNILSKISNMFIQLLLPYNHIEKESNYGLKSRRYYELQDNNEPCIYCSLSAIINYG